MFKLFLNKSGAALTLLATMACINCQEVNAQLIPDQTLGQENSRVTPQQLKDLIEGGAIRGENLFHSFEEFNINSEQQVYFANPEGINNIFTRVTGNNVSQILGTLGVEGIANLFLINPNGILFGPDARLDLNGSFVATTAESILFNNYEFSATNPNTPPLLTISVPLGLQYGNNPGEIINNSQASDNEGNIIGLQVKPEQTLALLGGNVSFNQGNITIEAGKIYLGSVGKNSRIALDFNNGLNFDFTEVTNFRDISLAQFSQINASGEPNSEVNIYGRNFVMKDESSLNSSNLGATPGANMTFNLSESLGLIGSGGSEGENDSSIIFGTRGTGDGGEFTINTKDLIISDGAFLTANVFAEGRGSNININAHNSVQMKGQSYDGVFGTLIQAASVSNSENGQGGNITINTRQILIEDGGTISASTFGNGNSGDLNIQAIESIELSGTYRGGSISGGLFAQSNPNATGNAGNVTINTQRLTVLEGAQISTSTQSSGNGGTMTINASELVEVSGGVFRDDGSRVTSGFFSSVGRLGDITDSTGKGGDIIINTSRLIVDEAQVTASTFADGDGGEIVINADNLVISNGGQLGVGTFDEGNAGSMRINVSQSIEIFGDGFGFSPPGDTNVPIEQSSLFAKSEGSGNAGSFVINMGDLIIGDEGEVSSSGLDSGLAGDLIIEGNSIFLDNGSIEVISAANSGGNINIQLNEELTLVNGSQISATAGIITGNGDGGNITIDSSLILAFPGTTNEITANAFEGNGGNIRITTESILGSEFLVISASSELGIDGVVEITNPDVDPSLGLVNVAVTPQDSDPIVAGCSADFGNTFVIRGRGGLPTNPNETLTTEVIWEDLRKYDTEEEIVKVSPPSETPVVVIKQATNWIFQPDGTVVLTAATATDRIPQFCNF